MANDPGRERLGQVEPDRAVHPTSQPGPTPDDEPFGLRPGGLVHPCPHRYGAATAGRATCELCGHVADGRASDDSPALALLTDDERRAMRLTVELANTLARIVGDDVTRADDLRELLDPVHRIQQAILANGVARLEPGLFRMLGERLRR